MQERLAHAHAGTLTEQIRERSFVNSAVRAASTLAFDVPAPGSDLRFAVGIQETTFRANVRWVTPLGEETASTS